MYIDQIRNFKTISEQEKKDKQVILDYIELLGDKILTRESEIAHITSSAFIMNRELTKTLMIHHNIYNSWGWTGGHADGEEDLLNIAEKELLEETGVIRAEPLTDEIITIDIIPVPEHIKKGKYVNVHLHLNITYVFIVSEDERLIVKEDENSGVKWIRLENMVNEVSEPEMLPIYNKIIERAKLKSLG